MGAMTTDNRTNEELASRLRQFAESQAMDFDSPYTAMMLNEVADRLSGTVTDAQVEAAAKIIRRASLEITADPGDFWSDCYESEKEAWRNAARAALVAAQGATPSVGIRALAEAEVRKSAAEGNPICEPGVTKDIAFIRGAVFGAAQGAAPPVNSFDTTAERVKNGADSLHVAPVQTSSTAPHAEAYVHCCNHTKCPGGSLCCCASEQRLRDCWNQWLSEFDADAKQAFRDGYQAGQNDPAPWMAPVLPSSGVDEDALAEVVCLALNHRDGGDECEDDYRVARAVAEWLKGQGNAARE